MSQVQSLQRPPIKNLMALAMGFFILRCFAWMNKAVISSRFLEHCEPEGQQLLKIAEAQRRADLSTRLDRQESRSNIPAAPTNHYTFHIPSTIYWYLQRLGS
jgi:hypothetical protein